jgi:hypothetical protein
MRDYRATHSLPGTRAIALLDSFNDAAQPLDAAIGIRRTRGRQDRRGKLMVEVLQHQAQRSI